MGFGEIGVQFQRRARARKRRLAALATEIAPN